ncbi:branched-chain amino acid transport system ATP-binding protein [Rhizobium sp. SG_E_25_P2]|uniref:ABC transporter ATP-binding protein n=1 Tax=Rhizobium sp. SG_E_25_P2 TaxID=2879942 RepID=UPI0024760DA6|nr:ABC transporter ATP-binding protein [Rhizobium sp. SG_E_25_P2]MDH6267227.1 branched-chain amino acid transport system ATP-binding protein [Rhizobium sp. SG_E_25_P2]
MVLSVRNLQANYGSLKVLFGVDLDLGEGETLALVGANGAGKTTLFSILTGLLPAAQGDVQLQRRSLSGLSARQLVRQGIAMVPEGRKLFPSLSVEENLMTGAYAGRPGPWQLDRIYELFPTLEPLRNRPSPALSGGQQQLVAIGRALMANPILLLCDELSLGLSPSAVDTVYAGLRKVREEGVSMVIVEQDIARALTESDQFACMRHGEIALSGVSRGADLAAISAAYFGEKHHA